MHHFDVVIDQQLLIGIVHPYAVRRAEMWRGQLHGRQVLDVRPGPCLLLDDGDFVARFGRVRVHQRVVLFGQARHGLEQLARTGHREARRERRMQTAVRGAVPALANRDALVDGMARLLLQPFRHLRVEVHHALADGGAQAAFGHTFEHHISVVHRLHRQHGGRAAREQLRGGEASRRAQGVRSVRGFHRPHASPQPVHQAEVVRKTAEEGLAQMDVGLDETGKDVAAARVDHSIVPFADVRPDRRDAPVFDRDVPLNDVELVVHRKDGAPADQNGHVRGDLCVGPGAGIAGRSRQRREASTSSKSGGPCHVSRR